MNRIEVKKPSKKEIIRVVKEWMERMRKASETKHFLTSDHDMNCPQCGDFRGISFYHDQGWMCRKRDCSFVFPKELVPPTPDEFEDYLKCREFEEKINMFLKSK